ncbi:MAG: hypothetical protein WBN04_19885, partial [Paracoccaceae bacterium]
GYDRRIFAARPPAASGTGGGVLNAWLTGRNELFRSTYIRQIYFWRIILYYTGSYDSSFSTNKLV